jgi:hypothetical protein
MVSVASKFGVILANFGTHQHFLQLLLSTCFNRKSSIFANNSLLSLIPCDPEGPAADKFSDWASYLANE